MPAAFSPMPPVLSTPMAAEFLGLSERQLCYAEKIGVIPEIRRSGLNRVFLSSDLPGLARRLQARGHKLSLQAEAVAGNADNHC